METSARSSWAARAGIALMVAGALLLIVTAIVQSSSGDSSGDAGMVDTATVAPTSEPLVGPSTGGVTATDGPGVGVEPEVFTTIQARITDADGEVCEVCLWLADDGDERGRGLMGVTDLGDADGMAFRYGEARTGSFYMFQTPTPLSIAWFGPDGVFIGAADMEPCLDTPAGECPRYSPELAYDLAIEVFQGDLDAGGIGPGSRVDVIEGSESDRCPADP